MLKALLCLQSQLLQELKQQDDEFGCYPISYTLTDKKESHTESSNSNGWAHCMQCVNHLSATHPLKLLHFLSYCV